jgi:hypothetical protein
LGLETREVHRIAVQQLGASVEPSLRSMVADPRLHAFVALMRELCANCDLVPNLDVRARTLERFVEGGERDSPPSKARPV